MLELICKVTLSFTPHPLSQWYRQSKNIKINLSMKCWNSAFNAQGSRVIIVVVQRGVVKIHVAAAVEVLRKKKREDENQFTTLEKLVWVPVISFCKISFPLMHLMAYYAETGLSRPLTAWLYG